MHFVTSDIDANQMEKAKGWAPYIYMPGANYGMLGHYGHLGVWRASKGLSNIVTTAGKTEWEADTLVLKDKGATATISPWGGDAIVQISKEHQRRVCNNCPISGGCGKYGDWVVDSTDVVTVRDKQSYQVTMNEKGFVGVKGKKWTWVGGQYCEEWKDYQNRIRIQLVSFLPNETTSSSGGAQTQPDGSVTPGTPPGAGSPPAAPPSPVVILSQLAPAMIGVGAVAIVGVVAYKMLTKKAPAPVGGA